MKNWKRPDNPYQVLCDEQYQSCLKHGIKGREARGDCNALFRGQIEAFEVGADAMLKAIVEFIGGVFSEKKLEALKKEAGLKDG